MLIDVYSNMHNEEILLPYWLRHYETFANRIFVWDDASTDRTREILEAHPMVTILPVDKNGDDDVYWINELFPQYKYYSRGNADWVIIADADEFVYHKNIKEVLKTEKDANREILMCYGFSMISESLPTTSGQIYEEIFLGVPDGLESKWTVFSPNVNIRFHKGRHGRPLGYDRHYANRHSGLKLLHYRYLGPDFFEQRDIKNLTRLEMVYNQGIAYKKNWRRSLPDKTRGVALDWFAEHKDEAIDVVNG